MSIKIDLLFHNPGVMFIIRTLMFDKQSFLNKTLVIMFVTQKLMN